MDPEDNHLSTSTASGKAIIFFLGNAELIPSEEMERPPPLGRLLSLAKQTHQNLDAQYFQFHQSLPTHPHSKFKDPHFFPGNSITQIQLTSCNLVSGRMRFYIRFSANLALQLQETRVPFRSHIEAFRSFMWHLD